jgi:hypothetical protein
MDELELTSLSFVQPEHGINFVLKTGSQDEGVSQISSKKFICVLSKDGWKNAKDLTQPFCEMNLINGYQWLYDIDIDLLLSKNGRW